MTDDGDEDEDEDEDDDKDDDEEEEEEEEDEEEEDDDEEEDVDGRDSKARIKDVDGPDDDLVAKRHPTGHSLSHNVPQ